MKRLSKSTDGGLLTKLVTALASGDEQSACVPLATNVDGRIQLSYRKVLPHVVFARLWRWPDLLSHRELDSVGSALCSSPYEKKTKAVCINPYHYRRKDVDKKDKKVIGEEGFGMLGKCFLDLKAFHHLHFLLFCSHAAQRNRLFDGRGSPDGVLFLSSRS